MIIPARNAASSIGRCVASAMALSPRAVEVIVVDDASEDDTAARAAAQSARVIRSNVNVGPGLARNLGAEAATGEFLAFTDSDCEVPSDWLARFNAAMSGGQYCGITGPYAGATHPDVLALLIDRSLRYDQRHLPDEIESCITSSLCVRKSDFDSIRGFPVYRLPGAKMCAFGNEDEELAYLLVQRTGKPVRWLRENGVHHGYRASLRGYFLQQAKYAEAILVSYARFPAMFAGRSNYSRGGGALKVLTAYIAIIGAALAPVTLYSLAGVVPFLTLNIGCVAYIARREKGMRRKMALALAAYPFLLMTALAWSRGLAVGATKALAALLVWRRRRS